MRLKYCSIFPGSLLDRGMEYSALRNVVVIFITTYDPFGLKRMIYTISNKCEEVPDMRELHEMVTEVKCDKEVGLVYMKAYELEQRLLRQGRKEGLARGEEKALLSLVIEKVKKEKNVSEIAEALEKDEMSISRRVEIVNRYAPAYDLEAILDEVLYGKQSL